MTSPRILREMAALWRHRAAHPEELIAQAEKLERQADANERRHPHECAICGDTQHARGDRPRCAADGCTYAAAGSDYCRFHGGTAPST